MPLFFLLRAIGFAIFLVDRHQRCSFSSSMQLTPLCFRLNAVNTAFFRLNAVNAAIFLVEHRQRRFFVPVERSYLRYFTGWLPLFFLVEYS